MNSTIPPPKVKKADALIGHVVNGKYKIHALVASGGMGKIYRAEQMPLGRTVALKVLHSQVEPTDDDAQFKKRFLREASILARLQHPNIVTVFDYGAIEGIEAERYFISMEFCSGETLARRIVDRASLATRETVRIARQIARGLTEAHAVGVIHRDLKPSNVMLLPGRDGEDLVKIVDFGIVKIVGDESGESEDLTQEGSFIGSPKYMAPEQITRGGKIDARTDVYSFGVILYQCLTGTVPFDAASSIQTLMAHLNQTPQPIRERSPSSDVPEWLDQLVMSCMEKDPERRPQTMDVVARTLADAEAAIHSSQVIAAMSRKSQPSMTGPMSDFPSSTGRGPLTEQNGARVGSGITTQGTISSIQPMPAAESDKTRTSPGIKTEGAAPPKRAPIALIAAVVVVLLGVGAFLTLRPGEPPPVLAAPAPPPPPPATLAAAPPPARFPLRIESVPEGADVREGDRVLGTTPLELSIDSEAVRTAPRALTLVKDGYAPYAITQGPAVDSVHIVATLVATPAAAASSVAARIGSPPLATRRPPAGGHGGALPSAQPAPAPSRPDLDIRMNR